MIEPTVERLEQTKKVSEQGVDYWLTVDFWPVDPKLVEIDDLFELVMDLVIGADTDPYNEQQQRLTAIGFTIGRKIVQAARRAQVAPRYFSDQLNRYSMILWTPICIWTTDAQGRLRYSLRSGVPINNAPNLSTAD